MQNYWTGCARIHKCKLSRLTPENLPFCQGTLICHDHTVTYFTVYQCTYRRNQRQILRHHHGISNCGTPSRHPILRRHHGISIAGHHHGIHSNFFQTPSRHLKLWDTITASTAFLKTPSRHLKLWDTITASTAFLKTPSRPLNL